MLSARVTLLSVFFLVLAVGLFAGASTGRSDTVNKTLAVGAVPTQAQLTPDGAKLYVSNEGPAGACPRAASTVSVIATSSDTVVATVPVGVDPGPVRFTPDGSRAYVLNQSPCDAAGTVSVIDVAASTVLATVPVGKLPVTATVSADGSKVYVANKGATSNSVSVICTGLAPAVCSLANTVIKTINLDPTIGIQPHTIAKNPSGSEVWVAEQDCPTVIGCTTGNIAVICTGLLVTATCNGANTDAVVTNITVGPTPGSIHFNPSGTRAYIANRGNNGVAPAIPASVSDINATSHSVVATIPLHAADAALPAPHAIRVTADGAKVYVLNRHADDVDVICTGAVPSVCSSADAVIKHIPVGISPSRAELTPNGARLYVTNEGSDSVSVISANLDQVMETVAVGSLPVDLEIDNTGSKAYVSNTGSDTVSVIGVSSDSDFDGFPDSSETGIGTAVGDPCGSPRASAPIYSQAWPADLRADGLSVNKVDLQDLATYVAPVRRINTSPGDAGYDPRWDVSPGNGGFGKMINISDLSLIVTVKPLMFGGVARAFNGPVCTP